MMTTVPVVTVGGVIVTVLPVILVKGVVVPVLAVGTDAAVSFLVVNVPGVPEVPATHMDTYFE